MNLKLVLLFLFFFFTNIKIADAQICRGSGVGAYTGYTCISVGYGVWGCRSATTLYNWTCENLAGGGYCSHWTRNDCTCVPGYGGCSINCGVDGTTTNGCTECTPNCSCAASTCTGSTCSDGCGGTCAGTLQPSSGTWSSCSSCTRTCIGATCGGGCGTMPSCAVDGTYSFPSCPADRCGQVLTGTCSASCGGSCPGSSTYTCSNADDGAPTAPSNLSPNSTNASYAPGTVPLSWTAGSSLTNYYSVEVYNDSTNALAWSNGNVGNVTSVTTGTITTPAVYRWRVAAINSTCGTDTTWSAWAYFRINSPPVITSITITNSVGTTVPVETGNRNHICQTTFADSASPRNARFLVNATDADGGTQITTITLTWNGRSFPITLQAAVGNNRVGVADMTFDGTYNGTATPSLTANVTDVYNATGTLTPRSFKIWDCNVAVDGTIYDGSPIISCPGTGFSTAAPDEMNFTSLNYIRIDNSSDNNMTVTRPATYTGGPLAWGRNYSINFNADLEGAGQVTRITDVNPNTTTCNALTVNLIQTVIDAYQVANPRARVDHSFIRNQVGWWQCVSGGVASSTLIESAVPVTCTNTAGCSPAMSIEGGITNSDGLVSSTNINSISGCTLGSGALECRRTMPKDTYINRNILGDEMTYDDVYSNYYSRYGMGVFFNSTQNLSDVLANVAVGNTGVVLINGDLVVNTNNALTNSQFLLLAVSGNIVFDSTVTDSAGIFVANGNISASGENANELNILGMLYAHQNISFTRGFTSHVANNSAPAVVVTYRPDLLFSMPNQLSLTLSGRY